jgi:hydroxymethylpyrimidine/phosphomethylpyrimidine kinase
LNQPAAVICIAGADPGQGAGLQMDQRVCKVLGLHFFPVVAVHTVQDAAGLKSVELRPAAAVAADLCLALDQAKATQAKVAIKTGALGNAEIVRAVTEILQAQSKIPVLVDPVRQASRSHDPQLRLLTDRGWDAVVQKLLPMAALTTPNRFEYGTGSDFQHCHAVLLKGGHAGAATSDSRVEDQLLRPGQEPRSFFAQRIEGGTEIHGTGCALSTAISGYLAREFPLPDAIAAAREHLQEWLVQAIKLGTGHLL